MLTEICAEVKNYFTSDADKHFGTFEIKDGTIAPPLDFLKDGQFYRIVGSTFNDGVHRYSDGDLTEETFDGAVWAMRVPPDFVSLCNEIAEFSTNDTAKPSAFTSESFGGYSYSKATNPDGSPMSWQGAFKKQLDRYRRVRV